MALVPKPSLCIKISVEEWFRMCQVCGVGHSDAVSGVALDDMSGLWWNDVTSASPPSDNGQMKKTPGQGLAYAPKTSHEDEGLHASSALASSGHKC